MLRKLASFFVTFFGTRCFMIFIVIFLKEFIIVYNDWRMKYVSRWTYAFRKRTTY